MLKRLAYKIVFNDLKKINIYCGIYDAKNRKPDFIYGIWTIMEHIAYEANERKVGEFNEFFSKNMDISEEKAKRRCSNHPSNGGSGICNCTLGTPQVKC